MIRKRNAQQLKDNKPSPPDVSDDSSGDEDDEARPPPAEEPATVAPEEFLDSEEEERRKDDLEFKAGQKIKAPRKRKFAEFDEEMFDTEVTLDDDPNKIVLPSEKKLRLGKKKMLPLEAFSDETLISKLRLEEDMMKEKEQAELESESESEDDLEDFDGLPRVRRGPIFKYSYKTTCGHVTKVWEQVMTYSLTEEQSKRCLVFIPEHVMDHHNSPITLTDFFMSCYNTGGLEAFNTRPLGHACYLAGR